MRGICTMTVSVESIVISANIAACPTRANNAK